MAATLPPPRLLPSGDSAITVEFSRNIDDLANQRVLALDRMLAREAIAGVTETVPTYRSLLVHYDPVQIGFEWWRSRSVLKVYPFIHRRMREALTLVRREASGIV